ncbi:hypothetical protein, partial [Brucella anthropi]|uniref:hypothetical protein n=1 Tax=Brucella anthropi TaxID=529 RepID=UPI0023608C0C
LKAAGSNPAPATKINKIPFKPRRKSTGFFDVYSQKYKSSQIPTRKSNSARILRVDIIQGRRTKVD